MDRDSKIDENNDIFCLVIMFTPIFMVFKISAEIAIFCILLLIAVKRLSRFG